MHSYPRWKNWLILAVLAVSLMASLPNAIKAPSWWPAVFSHPMSLGLDLKGGIHLVLDVDVDKAVAHSVEEDIDTARQALRKAKIRYRKLASHDNTLVITIKKDSDLSTTESLLSDTFGSNYTIAPAVKNTFTLSLKNSVADETRKFAVDQAIEVIRGRIDALGTTEPVIVKQGKHRFLVQNPGFEDSAHA